MKVQSAFLATAMAFAMISVACSASPGGGQSSGAGGTSSTTGTGGTSSTGKAGTSGGGPNGGSGGTASCPNGTACGGNVVGSWTVGSSCLTLDTSNVDITLAGLDPSSCTNVSISGSLTVTGTWSSKSDGTYIDGTTTSGTAQLQLPAGCLRLSGTTTTCARISGPLSGLGFASATCTDAAGGGCSCTATIDQTGGIGFLTSDPQTSGNYATTGSTLTADTVAPYSYCVAGTQLTLTPQPINLLTTGTVVLHSAGSTGTGGTTGTTGTAGTTGTTGTAGTNGTAGHAGTSGAAGTTGAAGTNGAAGHAGTTGTAGTSGAAGHGGAAGTSAPGGTTGTAGTTGAGGSTTVAQRPCDIYAAAGQPCAAAYSMIRTLRMGYTGALYQVRSGSSSTNTGSGGTTKDILQTSDGFADTTAQDTFCSGTTCTVSLLYDQSGNGNNLKVAPGGTTSGGTYSSMPDFESSANKDSLTISGHKVYALYMNAREGYRLTAVGKGMPTGAKAQGIYELADGTHSGTACCWDFGDVSTDPTVYTTMNTIFFGTGFWGSGAGAGPWFMGDFEGGVWAGSSAATPGNNASDPSMKVQFAFGIVKTNPPTSYAIRAANGNLPTATALTTAYSGVGPKTWNNSGGILLGIGSDNSNNSWGTFYEGAITNGQPSDATDLSVMQNVQAAGYGK